MAVSVIAGKNKNSTGKYRLRSQWHWKSQTWQKGRWVMLLSGKSKSSGFSWAVENSYIPISWGHVVWEGVINNVPDVFVLQVIFPFVHLPSVCSSVQTATGYLNIFFLHLPVSTRSFQQRHFHSQQEQTVPVCIRKTRWRKQIINLWFRRYIFMTGLWNTLYFFLNLIFCYIY